MIKPILLDEFNSFLSTVAAKRLKQHLERIFFAFLQHECTEGFPYFMQDLIIDLQFLYDLLDTIDREVDQSDLI